VEFAPANDFGTTDLEASLTDLADAVTDPNDVTVRGRTLLPDQQHVVDSLGDQRDIMNRHIAAQQAYLDSATAIEAGIRAYEQSDFDTTRTALTTAREALAEGIPEAGSQYRMWNGGLSLGQYATLLTRRQKAVTRILDAADESVSIEERQLAADEAIDLLFEARQPLASAVEI
jgi:hypothetical protein